MSPGSYFAHSRPTWTRQCRNFKNCLPNSHLINNIWQVLFVLLIQTQYIYKLTYQLIGVCLLTCWNVASMRLEGIIFLGMEIKYKCKSVEQLAIFKAYVANSLTVSLWIYITLHLYFLIWHTPCRLWPAIFKHSSTRPTAACCVYGQRGMGGSCSSKLALCADY